MVERFAKQRIDLHQLQSTQARELPRVNLEIFAEIVENGSKWLELSELKRFRHAQIDSETLGKIWIFDPDPTGFDSDLPEPGEPLYRF